ncbi:MAG: type II secretion system protein [Capsulimonadaceae bacterium]|nr:type II secretion system protein [Capsulimonadaceae bacterium]
MRRINAKITAGAFSLTELLIVISITAIIAAVMFPAFVTARERGGETTCASNLKQLGQSLSRYCQDYDDAYPAGFVAGGPDSNSGKQLASFKKNGWTDPITNEKDDIGNGCSWGQQLYPYVKNAATYRCPDDKTNFYNNHPQQSYAINYNLVGEKRKNLAAPNLTVSVWEAGLRTDQYGGGADPSTFDGISGAGTGSYDNGVNVDGSGGSTPPSIGVNQGIGGITWKYPDGTPKEGDPRHEGGNNWLAADGHVVFLPPAKVSPGPKAKLSTCRAVTGGTPPVPQCVYPAWWNAAGTQAMTQSDGITPVTLTFSTM